MIPPASEPVKDPDRREKQFPWDVVREHFLPDGPDEDD